MVVITRRPGEYIVIQTPAGERIEVAVLGITGDQVTVGTDAPAETKVLRGELASKDDNGI